MSYKKEFILRKERSFGQKIEATFEFIRLTIKPLFKSMFFYTSPFVLVGMFLISNVLSGLMAMSINAGQGALGTETDYLELGLSFIGFAFLMIFAGSMVMSVVYATTRVYDQLGNIDFTHKEVWAKVKKIYWPIFGSVFLYSIIFLVAYIIIVIPLAFLMAIFSFLILPIVYILIGFFLVIMLTALSTQIHEGKSLGNGMSQAFRLLKRNWWPALGLLIVLMLVYNAVTLIFTLPFYANFFIQMMNTSGIDFMAETPLWQELLSYLLGAVLLLGTFFSYCIPLVGMNIQYFHMSEKADAKSLISRIDQLGAQQEEEEEDY